MNPEDAAVVSEPGEPVPERVTIPADGVWLQAHRVVPAEARGLVLFTTACGCIRENSRAIAITRLLESAGFATLTFALLTPTESWMDRAAGDWSFDVELLAHRLKRITAWAALQPSTRDLGIGYFANSTFAAAALIAAAQLGKIVEAIVIRSGRPDFAGDWLPRVAAPTLLIVGERDESGLALNRGALEKLVCRKRLAEIPGAAHLFEEPSALEQVGELAIDWFGSNLRSWVSLTPISAATLPTRAQLAK